MDTAGLGTRCRRRRAAGTIQITGPPDRTHDLGSTQCILNSQMEAWLALNFARTVSPPGLRIVNTDMALFRTDIVDTAYVNDIETQLTHYSRDKK